MEVGNMISGLSIEVEHMKDELENIQAFLHDVERLVAVEEGVKHDRIKKWVKQLMEAAFRLEDIIDEYMIYEERQPRGLGCAALCSEIANFIQTTNFRHQIKYKYEDFKSRVREIKEGIKSDGFQIPFSSEQVPGSSREAPLYMDEADVVGFEAPSAELIEWLVNGKAETTVISVVGMGGLGKTTLAMKVFNSEEVKRHFGCRVWITVSRSYTVEELLRNMLRNFQQETGDYPPQGTFEMYRESLIGELRSYLQGKRYVLFFDDIWDTHFWDEIQFALINNMNGSKIFITTRITDVAMYCKRFFNVEVHKLQPLTREKSLELFQMKAFRSDPKGNIPKPLLDISSEIVEKCKGLPLAIVAIGSVLSGKAKIVSEWKRVSQNISPDLEKNSHFNIIAKNFDSSYDDLPSFLKPCLLYFAIYPEDYEVKSKRLIRQWIAEGFVKEKSGRTLEEVAEEYLLELINRSLVQVSSVNNDGKVKGCRVHDILREMILRKVEDSGFCRIIGEDDPSVLGGIIRRLSIATTSNDSTATIESSHVRSLFFFIEEELPEYLVSRILAKYKLLKVLDFESARLCEVPENLGDLIHLKYLSFRKTEVQSLPKSIGKLENLETLDLRQTVVNQIPEEVSKLRKLQSLLGNKMSLVQLKGGIGGMTALQTLSEVRIDGDGIELIRELGKLRQLRKLSLFDVREEQGTALCSSINNMAHLEKLYIETKSKDAAIDLSFVSCPAMLRKLRLQAMLNKLPRWIPGLENLVELSLSYSQLTDDPLKSLKDLTNLMVLNLAVHSYEGECLHFQEGGFQNLKELGLRYLYRLNSIIIDQGAMPSIKELTFMDIPNLKKAPSGILQLQKLEVLNTYFMPNEFEQSIAPLTGLVKEKKIMEKGGLELPVL